MMFRLFTVFLVMMLAPAAFASQSITHTESIEIKGRSLETLMMLAKERSLEYAMEELPALVMGREQLVDGEYSRKIESWQLAGLRHEFISTNISHSTGIAEFTSSIHYDKSAVVQALTEVSEAKRLTKDAASVYDLIREVETDTLSEHFLQNAHSAFEAMANQAYSDNDERMINLRMAQERVLAEAMKDVYMHYMIPAIQALRSSAVEVNASSSGVRDPKWETTLTYTPRLEPVVGSEPNVRGVIKWDDELNAILKPYQEKYPFITIATIIERMSVCSSTGDVLTPSIDKKPGFYNRLGRYRDGYNTNLRYLRPDYNTDTMRRESTTLRIRDYGTIRRGDDRHLDTTIVSSTNSISNDYRLEFDKMMGTKYSRDGRAADYFYHKGGESIGVCIH